MQISGDEVTDYQDLDSSFAIEILGRAGLSQYINTPKRKLQEMQLEVKEKILVNKFLSVYNSSHEPITLNSFRTKMCRKLVIY